MYSGEYCEFGNKKSPQEELNLHLLGYSQVYYDYTMGGS
jgi:hypothetical protein